MKDNSSNKSYGKKIIIHKQSCGKKIIVYKHGRVKNIQIKKPMEILRKRNSINNHRPKPDTGTEETRGFKTFKTKE